MQTEVYYISFDGDCDFSDEKYVSIQVKNHAISPRFGSEWYFLLYTLTRNLFIHVY